MAATIRDQQVLTPEGDLTATQEAQPGQPAAKPAAKPGAQDEEKKFRAFANKRIKEGKVGDLSEYEFLVIEPDKQKELIAEFDLRNLAASIDRAVEKGQV